MDVAAVAEILSAACRDFINPATQAEAEQTLRQFRASQAPYDVCRYILEQSSAEPTAKFQAVLAIRDAALREWSSQLTPDARRALIRYLLHATVVRFSSDPQPLVRSQTAAASATLLKRLWGEATQEELHALIGEIDGLAGQAATAEARCASMLALTAIVQEFNPSTATPMGLPWEYHEHCKRQLQEVYLLGFLQHALEVGKQSVGAALTGSDGGTCAASLALISAILSWDHTYSASYSSSWAPGQRPVDVSAVPVRPPALWRGVLLSQQSIAWLVDLATQLRGSRQYQATSTLSHALRQVFIQLCGMSGDIFVKEGDRKGLGLAGPPAQYTRGAHLGALIGVLLPEFPKSVEGVCSVFTTGEDAILDASRALLAAATAHRTAGFIEASGVLECEPSDLFRTLADITVAVLMAETESTDEVADILSDMWIDLVVDPCRGPLARHAGLAEGAAAVFLASMRRELARVSAAALEDENEYEGGEEAQAESWLAGLASIGRAACATVLPALGQQLNSCQMDLQRLMQSGDDPSAALERLCWVVQISSFVLADAADGETPLVPVALLETCGTAASEGREDPVEGLSKYLLALGTICEQNAGQAVISPRLMEEICTALGRWADTYLTSAELAGIGSAGSQLMAAFGPRGGGASVVESLIRLAIAALIRYPGETALHRATCKQLLAALVRRDESCQVAVQISAWAELCAAFAAMSPPLQALESGVQRILVQCLVAGTRGHENSEQRARTLHQLMLPISRGLTEMASLPRMEVQRADKVIESLNFVLAMRGATKSSHGDTIQVVFAHFQALQPAILHLLPYYQAHPAVYTALLDLAADAVAFLAPFLDVNQQTALFQWSIDVVGQFAAHATVANPLTSEQLEDQALSTCAMLRLLSELTNADAPDQNLVAAAVFAGLDRILPIVGHAHLKFPQLRRDLFWLLAGMVEAHAARVAALPEATLHAVLDALCFGIGLMDEPESEAAVFEAVAALAKHQLQNRNAGQHMQANKLGLGPLLGALLRRILAEDPGFEAVDFAAEAALPLLLLEPEVGARTLRALVSERSYDSNVDVIVTTALQQVCDAAQSSAALDRNGRKKFQAHFRRFVLDMRGLCQHK